MSQHYLVVSDLHLADIEDHDDGWKAYKGSSFVFDEELAALVDRFVAQKGAEGPLVLVLNGDVFDFDVVTAVPASPPWHVSRAERKRGLNPTAAKSAWKLELILSQHPRFVRMLAAFLAAGHRVVYTLGNHDRELHFPEVQRVLLETLRRDEALAGRELAPGAVRFEPWFYYVPGQIYVEHGHQFDYYSSFKNQLSPTVESAEGPVIALPMGNLSNRYLTTRMGFFNPHASDYILSVLGYIAHWAKYYLLSPRSLVFAWFFGSLLVISKLLRLKKRLMRVRAPHGEQIEAVARDYGLPTHKVKQLNRLHSRPIINRFYRIVREFWLDRVLIAVVMTGGTILLALLPIPLWIKLMVPLSSFPLIYFVYDRLAQGDSIFTVQRHLPACARAVSEILGVQVVALGHTHRPRLIPLTDQACFADTGTWAPITRRNSPQELTPGLRNYLVASFSDGERCIELGCWPSR